MCSALSASHPNSLRLNWWIDEHIGDHPYGVDIVIPNKYEGMDANMSTEELTKMLQSLVPPQHLDFAKKLLSDHGVPVDDADSHALQLLGWTEGNRYASGRTGPAAPEGHADRERSGHAARRHDQADP